MAEKADMATADKLRACAGIIIENDVFTTDKLDMGAHAMLCRGVLSNGDMTPNMLVGVMDIGDKRHLAEILAENCKTVPHTEAGRNCACSSLPAVAA